MNNNKDEDNGEVGEGMGPEWHHIFGLVEKICEHDNHSEEVDYEHIKNGLTNKKAKIVDYLAQNPGATNREIARVVDCSMSYPSSVRYEYSELIRALSKYYDTDLQEFEVGINRSKKRRADSWDELTQKQQEVLHRLADEGDPANPTSSLREIIEDLDFHTYPGYISDVIEKYSEFAVELKQDRASSESKETEGTPDTNQAVADMIQQLLDIIQAHKNLAEAEMNEGSLSGTSVGRFVLANQLEDEIEKQISNL